MSTTAMNGNGVRMKPPLPRVCRTLIPDSAPFATGARAAGPVGRSGYDRGFSVPERPADNTHRGPLRAFYEWLAGATSPPEPTPSERLAPTPDTPPARFAHYSIARKLGEGGMGVVYAARDERLERSVALKTLSSLAHDETARRRFWREARAAASVN